MKFATTRGARVAALAFAALAAILLTLFSPAQSANADDTAVGPISTREATQFTSPEWCVSYSGTRTCVQYAWDRQEDGDGVRIEGARYETSDCGELESSGGRYTTPSLVYDRPDGARRSLYLYNTNGCNEYLNLKEAGADTGPMRVTFEAKARVNFGTDKNIYIRGIIRPNGQSELVTARATDAQ